MSSFGQALRSLRTRHGLSQSGLSELIGCDHTYVNRLESGDRTPSREFIERMGLDLELREGDVDTLLAAAGFLPPSLERFGDEPEALVALGILLDPMTPESVRDLVRQALRVATAAGRMARDRRAA